MGERAIVVQSEQLAPEATKWLAQRCQVVAAQHDAPAFAAALREADALVLRSYTIVDDRLLAQAPRLRVVGRAGAGLDNIDVAACRRRGVEVVYTPDANTQAVLEYVIALVSDALRPRPALDGAIDRAEWRRLRTAHVGRQWSGLTTGVMGLGRIGRRVADVVAALGSAIVYNDTAPVAPPADPKAKKVSIEELFSLSDVITVHVDGRATNRAFVGRHLLSRMREDVVLLNTSRGFVVDNVALREFLQQHPEAQAHLDVHEPEPFDDAYPLLGLPNASLYPHLASRTRAALVAMSWVVRDVVAVLEGRPPRHPAPRE